MDVWLECFGYVARVIFLPLTDGCLELWQIWNMKITASFFDWCPWNRLGVEMSGQEGDPTIRLAHWRSVNALKVRSKIIWRPWEPFVRRVPHYVILINDGFKVSKTTFNWGLVRGPGSAPKIEIIISIQRAMLITGMFASEGCINGTDCEGLGDRSDLCCAYMSSTLSTTGLRDEWAGDRLDCWKTGLLHCCTAWRMHDRSTGILFDKKKTRQKAPLKEKAKDKGNNENTNVIFLKLRNFI